MADLNPKIPLHANGEPWTDADMSRASLEMEKFASSSAFEYVANYMAVQMSWCEKDLVPVRPEMTSHGRFIALSSRYGGLKEFFTAVDTIKSFREKPHEQGSGEDNEDQ